MKNTKYFNLAGTFLAAALFLLPARMDGWTQDNPREKEERERIALERKEREMIERREQEERLIQRQKQQMEMEEREMKMKDEQLRDRRERMADEEKRRRDGRYEEAIPLRRQGYFSRVREDPDMDDRERLRMMLRPPPRESLDEKHADFLREEFPHAFEEFNDLRRSPERDRAPRMMEFREFAEEMMRMREERPEVYEMEKGIRNLERQSERVGDEIREHKERSRDERAGEEMKKELAGMLEEIFNLRERRREMEAEAIERELRKIREQLEQRRENRGAIIQRRLCELTGETGPLEW